MNTQALQARLTSLFDSLKQTQQLISRLSRFPATPGSSPANPEEGDARVELSAEIHQSLKEQEEDFELLRQEIEDQTNTSRRASNTRRRDSGREREKTDLAAQVTRLGEELKIARSQFRKAQLQAKRNAEAAKRKERELLFAGIQEGTADTTTGYGRRKGQEKLSQEEVLLNASSDVTAALRRTHNLMTSELERSRFAQETLENSTKDLATLSESYTNLDTLLSSSRSLVGSLIHSQKSDTWYLESAFFVLVTTIGWLIFRRILYGPGWWLLYFPIRLLWRSSLFLVQILIGTLSTAAGAIGAKNQSIALSESAASLSATSSLAHKSAGRAGIPTFPKGYVAPSIRAGGGGQGAKMGQPGEAQPGQQQQQQQQQQKGEKSLSDQVVEMAEGTETEKAEPQGTVLRERTAEDGPPNPKKRMWEEPVESGQAGRQRDEL